MSRYALKKEPKKYIPPSWLGVIMLYPIYVHPGDKVHAYGVTIPDFPGCFSAADNWDDLAINVQQAIELYCEGEDMALPKPSLMESLLHDAHYQDGVWVMIEVDTSKLSGRAVRINITVPPLALSHFKLSE